MTRGNQREEDRQKAQKKASQKKPKSGASLAQRRAEDAQKLQVKQKAKADGGSSKT